MPNIRERLKTKLLVNQMYSKIQTADVREKIVKELYFEAVEKRLGNEDQDYIYEGQRLPIPRFVIDMVFQFLTKNKNIENIQINMRNGKTIHAELEWENTVIPDWEDEC